MKMHFSGINAREFRESFYESIEPVRLFVYHLQHFFPALRVQLRGGVIVLKVDGVDAGQVRLDRTIFGAFSMEGAGVLKGDLKNGQNRNSQRYIT